MAGGGPEDRLPPASSLQCVLLGEFGSVSREPPKTPSTSLRCRLPLGDQVAEGGEQLVFVFPSRVHDPGGAGRPVQRAEPILRILKIVGVVICSTQRMVAAFGEKFDALIAFLEIPAGNTKVFGDVALDKRNLPLPDFIDRGF